MNIDVSILNKISANSIHIKRLIHSKQVVLIPGMQDDSTFENQLVWYTPLAKWRVKYGIISVNVEKALDKIQHPFIIKKSPQFMHYRWDRLTHNKPVYNKQRTNTTHNTEKLERFSSAIRDKTGRPILTSSVGRSAQSNQSGKKNKRLKN